MKISKKRIEDAESILATQGADGNWDYDPYMHGMLNGMILMKAMLLGGESNFRDAPSKWGESNKGEEVLVSENSREDS